jgi:hypothetical protein
MPKLAVVAVAIFASCSSAASPAAFETRSLDGASTTLKCAWHLETGRGVVTEVSIRGACKRFAPPTLRKP